MQNFGSLILAALVTCALAACSNELKGEILVDGEAFVMDSCRSGQVYGFVGVEITSKTGSKIKIATKMSGESAVFYIPSGQSIGVEMGNCGPFQVQQQNSTINDVKNVEGKASLDCERGGHKLKGSFSFANCH